MSGNFAIKGGGVGRLMANAILNFHFDFPHPSLSRNGIKFKTQVDVYDFVKKRGMFVATQRTQVLRFMVEAHAIRYHLCVPCDFNSFAGRFHF